MKTRIGTHLVIALLLFAGGSKSQGLYTRIRQLDAEARAEEQQGRPDGAIRKYQEIVRLNPKLPAAYNNLGRLYYEQGRFQEALEPLKRAAELDPKLEAPHAQLAFCFFQMGHFEDAHHEFEAALKLKPDDAVATLFLARSLFELKDVKGALKLLDQLHQEDPNNAEVLFSLGWAYSALAVETLGAIQKVDPNSYLIDVLQGKYAEVKQAYAEAAEHYKRAVAKSPNQPDLCYDYAHALWASGDFPRALAEYRRVLEINPVDYRASWEAARIALMDNPQEALGLTDRALRLKPDIAEALTIRGRALLALKRPSEAIADFQKASTLDPNNAANYFHLARAYSELGRTQDAQGATAHYERLQVEAHAPSAEDTPVAPH